MLDSEQGKTLLRLARRTLEKQLGISTDKAGEPDGLDDPEFSCRQGVFVTLTRERRLRGCIGSLTGMETILEGVHRHVVEAALHDRRFPPLTKDELPKVRIEVSVLTPLRDLEHENGEDLIRQLRPLIDGVVLKRPGIAGATFLPQVWRELPQPELFLEQLCRKAGLPGGSWRSGKLTVQIYQVACFAEEEIPCGN